MAEADALLEMLRIALKRLYDRAFLRESPLVPLFGLQSAANSGQALQRALELAIDELGPDSGTSQTENHRAYQILHYRYVRHLTQQALAFQLNVSTRHLRREQDDAIRILAEHLRAQHRIPDNLDPPSASSGSYSEDGPASIDQEMAWLGDSLADHVTDVAGVMQQVEQLLRSLASTRSVTLDVSCDSNLPPARVATTVLRQIVLGMLTAAARGAPGGSISASATTVSEGVRVHIAARPGARQGWVSYPGEELAMARRLARLFGGCLIVTQTEASFAAEVVLPSAQENVVLAIEDNADTLQLWERYVLGTHFKLVGVREPENALETAIRLKPSVIVLDVMMPGVDGWDLLVQLCNHPRTSAVPVVVCTVLPQKDFALSLGARDLIQKPVTRRSFLAMLRAQVAV